MKVTDKTRTRLRKLLHERIPEDGMDDDTRFLDEDLNELLEGADIYRAASEGWMMKAGMYQEEMQDVRRTEAGTEKYEATRLLHRLEYAKSLSSYYAELAGTGGTRTKQVVALMLGAQRYTAPSRRAKPTWRH